jgi:hypothetical protein
LPSADDEPLAAKDRKERTNPMGIFAFFEFFCGHWFGKEIPDSPQVRM